jgi:hypothetical protein
MDAELVPPTSVPCATLQMSILSVVGMNGRQRCVAVLMGTTLVSSTRTGVSHFAWWRILYTFKRYCQCFKFIQNINYSRVFKN